MIVSLQHHVSNEFRHLILILVQLREFGQELRGRYFHSLTLLSILEYCHLLCYPLEYLVRLRYTIVLALPPVLIKKRRLISCVALSSSSVTQDGAAEVKGLDILLVLQ